MIPSIFIFRGAAGVVKAADGRSPPDPPDPVSELALIRHTGRRAI
jgi:hypothetical protein